MIETYPVDHQETLGKLIAFEHYQHVINRFNELRQHVSGRDAGILWKLSWKYAVKLEELMIGPQEEE